MRQQMSDKPKYVEIQRREREELEAAFKSDDANVVCGALYAAAQHEVDWRWSQQQQCLRMLDHESLLVRSAALIALGEIALFRGHLDLETVLRKSTVWPLTPRLLPSRRMLWTTFEPPSCCNDAEWLEVNAL
jgi:hypothetical protein